MGSENGAGKKSAKKRKLDLSPQQRKERSDRMKKLHKEGRAGPQFGRLGGRPRRPRASELIAEEAEKHKDDMVAVLVDAIDPSQPTPVRLKGLEQWLKIEQTERKMEMDEAEHLARMSRDELADHIVSKFRENPVMGKILMEYLSGQSKGDIVESSGSEVDDETG